MDEIHSKDSLLSLSNTNAYSCITSKLKDIKKPESSEEKEEKKEEEQKVDRKVLKRRIYSAKDEDRKIGNIEYDPSTRCLRLSNTNVSLAR